MDKGPMGMGLRLQDSLRVGAFKVEACSAKVTTDGAQGGKDEAWGGRAFVRYDWLPVSVVWGDSMRHQPVSGVWSLEGGTLSFHPNLSRLS